MSAAIQLLTPQADLLEKPKEITSVSLLEQKLRRVLEHNEHLQEEVRTLREELARAERLLGHKDLLLRNATLREQELRAELIKGCF